MHELIREKACIDIFIDDFPLINYVTRECIHVTSMEKSEGQ